MRNVREFAEFTKAALENALSGEEEEAGEEVVVSIT